MRSRPRSEHLTFRTRCPERQALPIWRSSRPESLFEGATPCRRVSRNGAAAQAWDCGQLSSLRESWHCARAANETFRWSSIDPSLDGSPVPCRGEAVVVPRAFGSRTARRKLASAVESARTATKTETPWGLRRPLGLGHAAMTYSSSAAPPPPSQRSDLHLLGLEIKIRTPILLTPDKLPHVSYAIPELLQQSQRTLPFLAATSEFIHLGRQPGGVF